MFIVVSETTTEKNIFFSLVPLYTYFTLNFVNYFISVIHQVNYDLELMIRWRSEANGFTFKGKRICFKYI